MRCPKCDATLKWNVVAFCAVCMRATDPGYYEAALHEDTALADVLAEFPAGISKRAIKYDLINQKFYYRRK